MEAGQASLINVVEALGSALTHSDAAVRARGVELLAGVAAKTPVPPRQAPNLIQFFVSRLHDHASVPGLLDGLAAILRAPGIGKSHAVAIPVQVLDSLNVQSYNQPVRHRVLSILRHAVDSFGPELAKQPEFVPGFVTALEGEKDPRNLLLGFGLARDIIERFDIEPYAEDMFEMLFSYFPITFRPPPDDVIGITAEDLKEALKSCLKATAFFAPFAMPALVEKLGTSSGAAKRDAVETISACAPVYGINAVAPHIDNIWELLKDDVEKAQEDSTEQKNALFCVRSILTTLSNSAVSAHNNPLEGMLKMVVGDCISHLKEPESKLARTSGRLVVASAAASDAAFSYAIQTAVPRLLELISTEREPKKRKLYLEILGDTIAAGTPLYAKKDGDDGELTNPLSVYVPDIAQILARVLQEDRDHGAAAVPAVRAACALIESGLLNADAKSGLYSMLHEAMLGSADGKVREEALSAIVKLSAGDAALAAQRTFPLLLESLKNEENLDWPLQCLKEMTLHHPSGAADILKTLVSQLALAREKMDAGGDAAEESDLLLSTLSSIVSGLDSLPSLASLVLFPLWSLCILSALSPSARFAQGALPAVSNITTTVTRSLSASFQSQLLIPTFQIFVGGDASSLGLTLPSSPVSHSSPAQITILSVLFASVLIATRREAELPIPAADLVAKLFSEASQAGSPVLAVSLAKGAASLVNKLCEVAGVKEVAERVSNDAIARIRDPSCSEADKRKHVIILIWVGSMGAFFDWTRTDENSSPCSLFGRSRAQRSFDPWPAMLNNSSRCSRTPRSDPRSRTPLVLSFPSGNWRSRNLTMPSSDRSTNKSWFLGRCR